MSYYTLLQRKDICALSHVLDLSLYCTVVCPSGVHLTTTSRLVGYFPNPRTTSCTILKSYARALQGLCVISYRNVAYLIIKLENYPGGLESKEQAHHGNRKPNFDGAETRDGKSQDGYSYRQIEGRRNCGCAHAEALTPRSAGRKKHWGYCSSVGAGVAFVGTARRGVDEEDNWLLRVADGAE